MTCKEKKNEKNTTKRMKVLWTIPNNITYILLEFQKEKRQKRKNISGNKRQHFPVLVTANHRS